MATMATIGANDDVLGVTSSVCLRLTSGPTRKLRRRQTQTQLQPQHGSQDLLDVKYSRSFVQVPSMEPKRTSVIVEYATAKRDDQERLDERKRALSNVEGVFLPLWIRVVDRSIILLLVALIDMHHAVFRRLCRLDWPRAPIGRWRFALPIQMFRKSFLVSRGFGLTLTVVYWGFLVVTMVSLVGAVRSIVVGFSTYKIFWRLMISSVIVF